MGGKRFKKETGGCSRRGRQSIKEHRITETTKDRWEITTQRQELRMHDSLRCRWCMFDKLLL